MSSCKYFTCQELIDGQGPVKLFHWNANKIGVFYKCLLLDGKTFTQNSKIMVTKESFDALVAYAYDVLGFVDQNPEYISYDEVLEIFPQADFYRWSPTVIGILYHAGLLSGKKSGKEGRNLVTRQSVLNLLIYTDQRFRNIWNKPCL